jgi:ATP-binding cassette subfamily A (ABC1) protein 3
MNLNAYWLGNFLYDYLAYILAALPLMILFYIFDITLYTEGEPVKAMWILTVIYGLANIPFTYLFSHIFNDFGFAQVFTYDFNIFVGTLLPLFVIAMRISQPKLSDTFQGIAWIFRVFPSYCYG